MIPIQTIKVIYHPLDEFLKIKNVNLILSLNDVAYGYDWELSDYSQDPINSNGYLIERSDVFFTVDDLGLLDATYFQILTVWLSDTTQKILVAPKETPDPMEMLNQMNGNFSFPFLS